MTNRQSTRSAVAPETSANSVQVGIPDEANLSDEISGRAGILNAAKHDSRLFVAAVYRLQEMHNKNKAVPEEVPFTPPDFSGKSSAEISRMGRAIKDQVEEFAARFDTLLDQHAGRLASPACDVELAPLLDALQRKLDAFEDLSLIAAKGRAMDRFLPAVQQAWETARFAELGVSSFSELDKKLDELFRKRSRLEGPLGMMAAFHRGELRNTEVELDLCQGLREQKYSPGIKATGRFDKATHGLLTYDRDIDGLLEYQREMAWTVATQEVARQGGKVLTAATVLVDGDPVIIGPEALAGLQRDYLEKVFFEGIVSNYEYRGVSTENLRQAPEMIEAMQIMRELFVAASRDLPWGAPPEEQERVRALRERINSLPYEIKDILSHREAWDKPDELGHAFADMLKYTLRVKKELGMPQPAGCFKDGVNILEGLPGGAREEVSFLQTQIQKLESCESLRGFVECYNPNLWKVFRANPEIGAIVGADAQWLADRALSRAVLAKLLESPEHQDPTVKLGSKLFDFHYTEIVPFLILNSYREPGYSGEYPFISSGAAGEKTRLAGYLKSLSADELAQVGRLNVAALSETFELILGNLSDFNKPRVNVGDGYEANPVYHQIQQNLQQICLHYLQQGSDSEKFFVMGILKRMPDALQPQVVNALGECLKGQENSLLLKEIRDAIRERCERSSPAEQDVARIGIASLAEHTVEPSSESRREAIALFGGFLEGDLSPEDAERFAQVTGYTEKEITCTYEFVRRASASRRWPPLYTYQNRDREEFFAAMVECAHVTDGIAAIERLGPYGYAFSLDQQHVLPDLVASAPTLAEQCKKMRGLIPDYVYEPACLHYVDPELREPRKSFCLDPAQCALQRVEDSAGLRFLRIIERKEGTLPEEFALAFLRKYRAMDPKCPQGAWPQFEPGVVANFSRKLHDLLDAAIDPESGGLTETGRFLSEPRMLMLLAKAPDRTEEIVDNSRVYGTYLCSKHLELREDPAYSYLRNEHDIYGLFQYGAAVLEPLREAQYPAAFLFGVIAQLPPEILTPEFAEKLCRILPASQPAISDKYNLEYLTTYVTEAKEHSLPLIMAVIENVDELTRRDSLKLLSMLSFGKALKSPELTAEMMEIVRQERGRGFAAVYDRVLDGVVAVLAEKYPADLLRAQPPEKLQRFVQVYSTYEDTLLHFKRPNQVPVMRVLAVVELLDKEREFRLNDPALIEDLQTNAMTYFPLEAERKAVTEYLARRQQGIEIEQLFPAAEFSAAERARILEAWNAPGETFPHILGDVSVEDRVSSVSTVIEALFHRGHLSPALVATQSLNVEQNPLKELADRWRAADFLLKKMKVSGAVSLSGSGGLEQAVLHLGEEMATVPDWQREAWLAERRNQVKQEQGRMSEWETLRSIGLNAEERLAGFMNEMAGCREKLGRHADLLHSLGFDFTESFRARVYRGELDVLERAIRDSQSGAAGNVEEGLQVLEIIDELQAVHARAEHYLQNLANDLGKSLHKLEEKAAVAAELIGGLSAERSVDAELLGIETRDKPLAGYLRQMLSGLEDPAQQRETLRAELERYRDLSAIADIKSALGAAGEDGSSEPQLYIYRMETVFSRMLEAMKGQCLDYRSSRNSIGNSVYNISLNDVNRQVMVACDSSSVARVDAITYLAPVSVDGADRQPAMVMDLPYVPDGTLMSWSKFEGYLEFALQKASRMGLPLVVPERAAGSFFNRTAEFSVGRGYTSSIGEVGIDIMPGPSGSTYVELAGFSSYENDHTEKVTAIVLRG